MSSIVERFSYFLKEIEYPKTKEDWHIKGMLHKFSNQIYKFDVRDMIEDKDNTFKKGGSFKTKAEKFVFETDKFWLIFDIEEFLMYLKEKQIYVIRIEEMIKELLFVWKIEKKN